MYQEHILLEASLFLNSFWMPSIHTHIYQRFQLLLSAKIINGQKNESRAQTANDLKSRLKRFLQSPCITKRRRR